MISDLKIQEFHQYCPLCKLSVLFDALMRCTILSTIRDCFNLRKFTVHSKSDVYIRNGHLGFRMALYLQTTNYSTMELSSITADSHRS